MEKDIINELEQLNSPLAKISRAMPFSVPEHYFDHFESMILNATAFDGVRRETPFKAPDGYFEQLPAELLAKAKSGGRYKSTDLFKSKMIRPLKLAAAAAILILAGWGVTRMSPMDNSIDQQLNNLPDDAVAAYVVQTGDESDTEDIRVASGFAEQKKQLTEEEIEAYLNENDWQ